MKIDNRNRNIRARFENSIAFSFDRKFDSLDLKTSQGTFNRDGHVIRLIPETSAQDTLFAKFFYRRKFICVDTATFAVIKPEVFPSFGVDLFSKLNVSHVKACGGLIFNIRITDDHWEGASIKSYRFSVIRNDSFIFSMIEYSYKFSDDLKTKLDALISGDKILISDIILSPYYDFANPLPGVFEIE
jgi:hypothetical protein